MGRFARVALGFLLIAAALLLPLASGAGAQAQTPTRTPTPRATATATRTPTPTPGRGLRARVRRVILPAPSVKNNLVGDVVSDPEVPLSANYPTLFGDRIDFGMANFRDVTAGIDDGDGITSLTFTIFDMEGLEVFTRESSLAEGFCAFGGSEDECLVHDFSLYGSRWPDGEPAHSGRYTLVAFAQGVQADHKGAWTLSFEVRLSSDEGMQETDGTVLVRSIARSEEGVRLEVETLGFTPFAQGTHLHIHPESVAEVNAVGGAAGRRLGVIEFPDTGKQSTASVVAVYGTSTILIPTGTLPAYGEKLCLAIAHPDHSVLPGRGLCVAVPD